MIFRANFFIFRPYLRTKTGIIEDRLHSRSDLFAQSHPAIYAAATR